MSLKIHFYIESCTKESEGSGYEEASGNEDDENDLEPQGQDYRCVSKT